MRRYFLSILAVVLFAVTAPAYAMMQAPNLSICIDLQNQLCDASLTSLEMGPTPVGGNAAAILEITNNGTGPLAMNYSFSSPTFTFQPAPPNPLNIAAAVTLKEPVSFTPTTAGRITAQFVSTDNAPGSPHTLPLSGTGVNVPAGDFVLMLDPAGPSTIALKAGGTTTFPLYVLVGSGVPPSALGTIQCSGGRPGTSCTFNLLSFFAVPQERLVVTVQTPAQAALPTAAPIAPWGVFAGLAAMTALCMLSFRRRPRLALAGVLLLLAMGVLSCGGGSSSSSSSPPLTFSATINGVSHTLTVPVTVQ